MKKILQVVGCLELGGTEAFIMNHYRNIDRNKYQFDFLVFTEKDYPYISEIKQLGGNVFFAGTPSIKHINSFYMRLKNIVNENGPYDVIHSHVNIANSWVLYFAKKLNIPIRISHSHDYSIKKEALCKKAYRNFQKNIIKRYATIFLACSKIAGEYLYGKDFFNKHGQVIHNGINISDFQSVGKTSLNLLKKEFNINDEYGLVVGNITRFEDKKNSLFTLNVFNEILKIYPKAILIMGGPDGGLLEIVKQRIKELNIQQSVRLIGKRKDVPVCLNILDAYIFPSKYEGLGIVMLEAQASGIECFASTCVSSECDMGLNKVHFYSLEDSPSLWAERIVKTMENKNFLSNDEIRNAFIKKGYDIEESVKRLQEVYDGT